jgi:hypothetical protein
MRCPITEQDPPPGCLLSYYAVGIDDELFRCAFIEVLIALGRVVERDHSRVLWRIECFRLSAVESHISRKTSEMWGTRDLSLITWWDLWDSLGDWTLRVHAVALGAGILVKVIAGSQHRRRER